MLVVKSMVHVFKDSFDVAATWRQEPEMPVNGGILFVRGDRLARAKGFFQCVNSPPASVNSPPASVNPPLRPTGCVTSSSCAATVTD
eukprot:5655524-Pyramimonas_sp.AAC.1